MQRRIVFCADDLGISPGTNAGIRAAALQGLVKETSLCVTGIALDEGVEIAHELADSLSVGLHLSFTLGSALTGPLRGLTDDDGVFLPLADALRACLFKKPEPTEVQREVEAQLARLTDLGIHASHLNGHHHVHCFPVIRDAVVTALASSKLRWTRLPRERSGPLGRFSPRRLLLASFSRALGRQTASLPTRHLPFLGLSLQDRADYREIFVQTLTGLPAGDYEWMVHPREPDDSFARLDHLQGQRGSEAQIELTTLTDPAFVTELLDLGVQPVRFADLT